MMLRMLLAAAGIAATVHAQPAASTAFEVTSVKPNRSPEMRNMKMQSFPGGRFSATNLPLRLLIVTAYNLPFQSMRLSGGPEWINSERFDIEARAAQGAIPSGLPDNVRQEKMRLMLQSLLADRFKLTIRRESRELPFYALVVAKNGAKLQRAGIEEKDCTPGPVDGVSCHGFRGGQGRGLHGKAVTMADLVQFIENWTDHPVEDTTGIQGLFDIETDGWVPMRGPPPRPATAPNPSAPPSPDGDMSDPTRPTLFMVLEKLGLGLKLQKGPIDIYVIEHVERPTEN
jgi:uncharacterized protein (TIGR03435 family)